MAKWIFVSVPCLTCLSFLAAGAWPRPVRNSPLAAADPFLAQPLPLDQIAGGGDRDGAQVLQRVRATLRDVRWLSVTIWQRLHDGNNSFESTAKLILGPDQCARMETTLQVRGVSCRQLLVSDGRAFAEVERWPGESEKISGGCLPGMETGTAREQFLRRRGCTGPLPLVSELQTSVRQWQVLTGMWQQRPVLRLQGTLEPGGANGAQPAARCCRLYVDAASLLPLRLEWYKHADPQRSPLFLEMEYRDLELNRPLSAQECARAFTFQAEK